MTATKRTHEIDADPVERLFNERVLGKRPKHFSVQRDRPFVLAPLAVRYDFLGLSSIRNSQVVFPQLA